MRKLKKMKQFVKKINFLEIQLDLYAKTQTKLSQMQNRTMKQMQKISANNSEIKIDNKMKT